MKKIGKLLILGLVLSVALVVGGFYLFFEKNLENWDGKRNINILLVGDCFYIGNLSIAKQRFFLTSYPDNFYVETFGGFGSYPIDSIWDLYKKQEKPVFTFLQKTIVMNLGVYTDGYLSFRDENIFKTEFLDSLKKGDLDLLKFIQLYLKGKIETNLSPLSLYRLVMNLRGLRKDQVVVKNLSGGVLEKKRLADGSYSYTFDKEILDSFLKEVFSEVEMINEDLRIAVFNATNRVGKGETVLRIITNSGGKVVMVGNFEKKKKKSEIWAEKKLWDSYTFRRLEEIFGFEKVEKKGKEGDIVLVIGEDWVR